MSEILFDALEPYGQPGYQSMHACICLFEQSDANDTGRCTHVLHYTYVHHALNYF